MKLLSGVVVLLVMTVPPIRADELLSTDSTDTNSECGLYLAVSSTSSEDDPKWGLYAGKAIPKYSPIGYGEVGIQTFHLMANALEESEDGHIATRRADLVDFLEQYIWVPHSSGGQFELGDAGRTVTAVPGLGVLGGYNARMSNADWNHTLAYRRPAWGEEAGVSHPGRGASSPYFEISLSATDTIPAGMEIFTNYGDNWKSEEEDNDKEEQIAVDDHPKIDETIDKMIEFFEKHEEALDPQSKKEIYQFLVQDVLHAAAGAKKGKLISSLLPESPEGLKEVKENGGALALSFPSAIRSLPWLAKNGLCVDNIRPGPSTIPHAGRGAFATRSLKAGATIVPVPLVHLADSEIMKMHPLVAVQDEEDGEYFVRKAGSQPIGSQLLLNYCLGHPDSKLLFFPSGPTFSFINHSPEPNAKLVWSDHPNNHLHWFDLKPMRLHGKGNQHLGLLMEVIATKDIEEGEEVTINYGPEWMAAWNEYVAKWQAKASSRRGTTWPVRSLDYNNMFANKPIPLNPKEYPTNLMLKCFLLVKKPPNEPPVNEDGEKVRLWTETDKTMKSENLFDCKLMDVEEITTPEGASSWNYTIKWDGRAGTTWVKKVPQKAIVFVDRPGTSDLHILGPFRHYIGIPDEIFPKGRWRNINAVEQNNDGEAEDDDFDEED